MLTVSKSAPARLLAGILVAGASLLLVAGCGAPAGGSEPAAGGDVAPAHPGEAPAPADGPAPRAPDLPGDRKLARTANIVLEVGDVERAAAELRRLALVLGGLVTSEVVSLPTDGMPREYDTSHLVLTVPAERLDETLTVVAGLGEVRSRTVESVDVTDAVVDVASRVKTMRESIARLQELMRRAGSVSEIAQVESELTQRQAELEALLAQQASLSQRVATSPVTVTLIATGTAVEGGPGGFLAGLEAGWQTMQASGLAALTVLGALLPWLALAAVFGVPLWLWRRRLVARRNRPAAPASPNADRADGGPSAPDPGQG